MRTVALTAALLLLLSSACFAVEIKHAKAAVKDGTITVTYDLLGKPGERKANVKVAIVVDGERYLPGTVNIVGDYGANVGVGLGRKISWNLLKDMPAGYKGVLSWELDAESEASNDPFNIVGLKNKVKPPVITENTVADPKSKLIWTRTPLRAKQLTSVDSANSVVRKMNQSNYAGFNDWRLPKKDEFESLLKMIELYGYQSGQSSLPYFAKVGFDIDRESRFWTIDKSSIEFSGREVFVAASGNYGGSSNTSRTSTSSSRYNRSASTSTGAAAGYSGSASIKQRTEDSGMYDVILDTKNGYFYKHNGADSVDILAVRGDAQSEIYAVSVQVDVAITP